jgi:hypothetical protein
VGDRLFEGLRSSVVSKLTDVPKRILIGRALRSDRLGETLLPKRIALPVFASDPLSSVAYAPGEVLLVLSIAGFVHAARTPQDEVVFSAVPAAQPTA